VPYSYSSFASPFTCEFPVHSIDDVLRIEAIPLEQALTVRSTYEIFRNSAHAYGDKTALTFLRSGNPDDAPIRWSYSQLLSGIHQTAVSTRRASEGRGGDTATRLPGISSGLMGR